MAVPGSVLGSDTVTNPDYGGRTALRWRVRAAGREARDLARLPQPSRAVAQQLSA